MSTTRLLARSGAALVAIAALSIGTTSAAYAEKSAATQAKSDSSARADGSAKSDQTASQGSTNHSCDGSHHSDTGHGANTDGPTNPYHNTCDEDVASANGKGGGAAKGRPAAGTVGNADDKNPRGQAPGPQDRNNGYECDGNQGIAKGNPAHTGCTSAPTASPLIVKAPTTLTCPDGRVMTDDVNHDGAINDADCTTAAARPAGPVVTPPVVAALKLVCPSGDVMTEDVNHDGVISNADCAQVLGRSLVKPTARPLVPAAVAGVRLDNQPLAVGGLTLPVTGADVRSLLAYAGMLLAAGGVLLATGRRTGLAG